MVHMGRPSEKDAELLQNCYANSLKLMLKKELRSIVSNYSSLKFLNYPFLTCLFFICFFSLQLFYKLPMTGLEQRFKIHCHKLNIHF